jgi:hypothetical protein
MRVHLWLVAGLLLVSWASADARVWTDNTGKFTQEAELVDFDERIAVLKKDNGRLVAIEIEDLSKEDREYLASKEAKETVTKATSKEHVWTLTDGEKIAGRVVRYGRREVVLERRNNRIFVNGRPITELSKLQQTVIPRIVAHFEKKPVKDMKGVESVLVANKGRVAYNVDGVLLELDGGDLFAVPFFLFSEKDLAVLEPGWDEWLEAEKDQQRQQEESTMLRSLANEYQKNQAIDHRIQMLRLASEWFDLWQVVLIAPNGAESSVVVPARNSAQAQLLAKQQCPACGIGATRRISRRY